MGKKLRGGILPFGDNISFLMKGLWFTAAQKMTMQPEVAKVLAERGERWVPWILMGLGVWILFKNETWRWLLS